MKKYVIMGTLCLLFWAYDCQAADIIDWSTLSSTFTSNYPGAVAAGLGIFVAIAVIGLILRIVGKFGVRGSR